MGSSILVGKNWAYNNGEIKFFTESGKVVFLGSGKEAFRFSWDMLHVVDSEIISKVVKTKIEDCVAQDIDNQKDGDIAIIKMSPRIAVTFFHGKIFGLTQLQHAEENATEVRIPNVTINVLKKTLKVEIRIDSQMDYRVVTCNKDGNAL